MPLKPEVVRYSEMLQYVDTFGANERMALLAHLLATVDPTALIPARGWMLTEQGHSRDILTVNLYGSVPNKHAQGTISFCETVMPRSKLGRSLFMDMESECNA